MGAAASAPEAELPAQHTTSPPVPKPSREPQEPEQIRKTLYDIVLTGVDELAATAPEGHKEELWRMYARLLDFYTWDP